MSSSSLSKMSQREVVATVNRLGLTNAANALGTSSATLCRWLKDKRFVRRTQYVKEAATPQTT